MLVLRPSDSSSYLSKDIEGVLDRIELSKDAKNSNYQIRGSSSATPHGPSLTFGGTISTSLPFISTPAIMYLRGTSTNSGCAKRAGGVPA